MQVRSVNNVNESGWASYLFTPTPEVELRLGARYLADGRAEFGLQLAGGVNVSLQNRFLTPSASNAGMWRQSDAAVYRIGGVDWNLGRVSVRFVNTVCPEYIEVNQPGQHREPLIDVQARDLNPWQRCICPAVETRSAASMTVVFDLAPSAGVAGAQSRPSCRVSTRWVQGYCNRTRITECPPRLMTNRQQQGRCPVLMDHPHPPSTGPASLRRAIIGVALLLAVLLTLAIEAGRTTAAADDGSVDIRVWQDLDEPLIIYVSARPEGGRWADLGTFRLLMDDGIARGGAFRYGDFAVGEVVVRIWQGIADPDLIEFSARRSSGGWPPGLTTPLTLDQLDPCCSYRYADFNIELPPHAPLVGFSPGGDEVPRLSALRVAFSEEPRSTDPDRLIAFSPASEGSFTWLDERTLLFQPSYPGWAPGQTYSVRVNAQAAGLQDDHLHSFTADGRLSVSYVIPGDGDVETPTNAQILVQFNRAVTSLTVLQAAPTAPLLRITPALEGRGEWLSTSLYRFIPDAFAPNTRYTVRIPAKLTADAHGALASDFVWSFRTVLPAVASITPHDRATNVVPGDPIVVEFNQPMVREAVESGLVVRTEDQESVSGAFAWNEDSSTVAFTPETPLGFSAKYEIIVPAGLQGLRLGRTRNERRAAFTTIEKLELIQIRSFGNSGPTHLDGFRLLYSRAMQPESFDGRVSVIDSAGEAVNVERIVASREWAHVYARLNYSATYTIRIAAGVSDRHGLTLPAYEQEFQTGQYVPPAPPPTRTRLSLAVPGNFVTLSADGDQQLYFHAQGLSEVEFSAYPLTDAEVRTLYGRNYIDLYRWGRPDIVFWPESEPVREWRRSIDEESEKQSRRYSTLLGDGESLPVGHYLLIASSPSVPLSQLHAYQLKAVISVVDTAVITKQAHDRLLVWALDHASGEPVPGETIRIHRIGNDRVVDSEWSETATNADGLADATGPSRFLIRVGGDGERFGVASSHWGYGYSSPISTRGQLYTDRPIYRAGETVFYKGVVRHDVDAAYSIPRLDTEFRLTLQDPEYATIVDITGETERGWVVQRPSSVAGRRDDRQLPPTAAWCPVRILVDGGGALRGLPVPRARV